MPGKRRTIKSYAVLCLSVLAGNALLAFLVAAFVLPRGIIMGGTTGIGIVLSNVTGQDTALFVFLLNLALLLFGLCVLGKRFFFSTAASSVLYPAFLAAFQRIPGIDTMTDNDLLAAIFAGCLLGVSLGLVMRVGSSTGGMDVVNLVFHKWFHFPIAVLVWVSDLVVIGGQAIFAKPERTLLGLLVLMLETIVLDQVMLLGRSQLQIYVVSDRYEQIRDRLLHELGLGVTMTLIETGLLGKQQKGVLCVVHPRRLYAVTVCIRAEDPQAFITITKIKEVHGKGFTLERTAAQLEQNSLTDEARKDDIP